MYTKPIMQSMVAPTSKIAGTARKKYSQTGVVLGEFIVVVDGGANSVSV